MGHRFIAQKRHLLVESRANEALGEEGSHERAGGGPALAEKEKVVLVSSPTVPGREIKEVKGLVVAARPVSLTVAGVEDEIEALLDKLRKLAAEKNADAVVDVKIDVRRVGGAGLEWALLLAYGTAVVLGD